MSIVLYLSSYPGFYTWYDTNTKSKRMTYADSWADRHEDNMWRSLSDYIDGLRLKDAQKCTAGALKWGNMRMRKLCFEAAPSPEAWKVCVNATVPLWVTVTTSSIVHFSSTFFTIWLHTKEKLKEIKGSSSTFPFRPASGHWAFHHRTSSPWVSASRQQVFLDACPPAPSASLSRSYLRRASFSELSVWVFF